ncbi:MAG: ABC transporter ATP-binding protein, partial [Actinomyces succiniciruminis]|nr:ABC transporter ATP-binding protein [Actinomyces succiniciruminis]
MTSGLSRTFGKERFVAVDDLSLSVTPGQVHALLGPNGAGKTTTVRMCATLLAPTAGQIQVDGIDAVRHPEAARARLGLVLGGELGFYPRATALDNLLFFADLQGLDRRRRRQAVDRALERMGLADAATRKAGAFSRGMLQRLHLARALLGSPPLLLLDEPTTGLDPDVALQVRDLIRELA